MNYRVEQTSPMEWTGNSRSIKTESGLLLEKSNIEDAMDFLKVPKTLINIDNRYGTDTLMPVIKAIIKPDTKLNVLVDDDDKVVSIVDPRSKFVQDSEFDELKERVQALGLTPISDRAYGVHRQIDFDLNLNEDLEVFGDLFKRNLTLVRNPQGGLYFGINLLRLICTNGCTVQEASSRKVIRSGEVKDANLKQMVADLSLVDLNKYIINSFSKNGELYLASVADFLGMKRTLASITDKDTADEFFPTEPIEDFYKTRDIDIHKISLSDSQNLSSGLSYFDSLNILTNAVKENETPSLQQQIEVGKWMSPRHAKALFFRNFMGGQPAFSEDLIASLKGDTK